ncbi:MAG TPA: helix-turn-helix transcriptional regulator [Erythrobacter sp.]|nr:helix-turn-helix transcriptional regulator [Erythrobacter sp.]
MISSGEWSRFSAHIDMLERDHPDLAAAIVPAGITGLWGASLGWPAWLVSGTDLPPLVPLPGQMRLSDDLRCVANLLQHVGKARLIELVAEMPRFPGDAQVLAAPDLRTAILSRSQTIGLQNAPIRTSVSEDRGWTIIHLDLHPLLGPFLPLWEAVVLAFYFRIAGAFARQAQTSAGALSEIRIRQVHSGPVLARTLPCEILRGSTRASISFPDRLLDCANPAFDAVVWQAIVSQARVREGSRKRRQPVGKGALEELLRRSLVEHAKAPQFPEVARMLGISVRTLSREFAEAGISFRDVRAEARLALGSELLLHSDLPVSGIAARLGYSDATAFVRSFHRRFGVSPARWRKSRRIAPAALA